jgi:hypothetical protein
MLLNLRQLRPVQRTGVLWAGYSFMMKTAASITKNVKSAEFDFVSFAVQHERLFVKIESDIVDSLRNSSSYKTPAQSSFYTDAFSI